MEKQLHQSVNQATAGLPPASSLPLQNRLPSSIFSCQSRCAAEPSVPLKQITQKASWPTFDRASLFNIPSERACVQHLFHTESWHLAGLIWRSRFLLEGEVYQCKRTQAIFRVMNCGTGAVLVWPLDTAGAEAVQNLRKSRTAEPASVFPYHGTPLLQDCFCYKAEQPYWINMFEWDEFAAVPCSAISPLGAYTRGFTKTIEPGVWLHHNFPCGTVLQHAARKSFKGLRDQDLKLLARELGLDVSGSIP